MSEFFVVANSNAAPFVSDTSEKFVEAADPVAALEKFVAEYRHPAGLYAAAVYKDATAYHKNGKILARWLTHKAQAIEKAGTATIYSKSRDHLEIDGKEVKFAAGGSVVQ